MSLSPVKQLDDTSVASPTMFKQNLLQPRQNIILTPSSSSSSPSNTIIPVSGPVLNQLSSKTTTTQQFSNLLGHPQQQYLNSNMVTTTTPLIRPKSVQSQNQSSLIVVNSIDLNNARLKSAYDSSSATQTTTSGLNLNALTAQSQTEINQS